MVMKIIIFVGNIAMNVAYAIHKLFPVKNRISIISRQSDKPSLDIELLKDRFKTETNDVDVCILCKKIGGGLGGKIAYLFHILGPQMHAFATSKVVLLDGYCISASMLKHKKGLKIIQMWHAMGSFKMFGRSILDMEEGSSSSLAEAMHMHEGYHMFFASSKKSLPYFASAFGCEEDRGHVVPLPRYDYLTDSEMQAERRSKITKENSISQGKINILYAPTFRKGGDNESGALNLLKCLDLDRYNFIYSHHPLTNPGEELRNHIISGLTSLDLLAISDVVISDYSALIYESAVAGIPTYLYTYDYEDYYMNRNFYIDMDRDIPLPRYDNANEVCRAITDEECKPKLLASFADEFVTPTRDATGHIVKLVTDML